MYLNHITITGRLVADPLFTKGQDDNSDRVWGRIACNRPGTDDKADFVPFVCWGATARAVAEHCKKGKMLGLNGSLRTRSTQKEDQSYENYFEVNCSSVAFGADAKNTAKPAEEKAKAVAPKPAQAAATLSSLSQEQLMALLQGISLLTEGRAENHDPLAIPL